MHVDPRQPRSGGSQGGSLGLVVGEEVGLVIARQIFGSKVLAGSGSSSPLTTKGDLYGYDTANTRIPVGTDGQVLTADSTQAKGVKWGGGGVKVVRGAHWSAGTSAILVPTNDVPIEIPYACTITKVVVLTVGGTGSCIIDIWKKAYASYPPTVADTITAAALPTISSGIKYSDSTLTGWTTAISAGDTLMFHLQSSSVFTNIVIMLELQP